MPDVQLNGIEFSIKSDTTAAVVSIDHLRKALSKLQKIHINDLGLKSASREIRRFANSISSIQTQKLDALSKSLRGLSSFGNAFGKIGEEPEKFSTALATMTVYLREMSTIDFTNLQVAGQSLNQIATSANKIGNKAADGAKSAANGIKQITKEAKKSASPLSNLLSSLKRIAFYRIIRSIIKSITEAFQEGLKNAYEFSKATGDQAGLAKALDNLATKSLTMKNQLGAAFGQLLVALTPVVIQIINLVTKLAEALTRLIAILGGSDTYLRAKDVWTEWGDAAQTAGGQAKKALEYLAPFDELNVLPDPKSGGGGGGSASNIGDMFEYVSTSEGNTFLDAIKDMLDKVSNFFETTNWREVADTAWQKLKEAFSDNGKATEVVEALFEALGAALGAGVSFVVNFVANIGNEIITRFKSFLIDGNGDGKISIKEFLDAVFLTGASIYQSISDWVEDHVINPLFEGFAKGLGLDGKEELLASIQNLGIDILNFFTQKVINPVISAWNNMVDGLPQWLQDAIKNIAGVDTLTIPLIGDITHVGMGSTVHVDESGGLMGGHSGSIDGLAVAMQGAISTIKDNLSANDKKVNTTAVFNKKVDGLTNSTSDYGRQIYTTARFNQRSETDNFKNKYHIFASTANFTQRTSGSKFSTNFSSTATFNKTVRGEKFSTNFTSTANFTKRTTDANKFSTTFGSTANFTGYTIKPGLKDGTSMKVDAKVNIVGQTNTPTVAVNAKYNFVTKANGGVYNHGVWSNIPQYAGGTSRAHGSLFVAGEAGPEVVGHIGGRTEVLNRSQLAATMYSAVRSAMASTAFRVSASPSPAYSTADGGGNEDVLYRAFKRALDETDFGGDVELDGQTLYRAMVNRNRQNTRLTGVNAMA